MARLYADENFPLPVVMELRRLGHDVLTASEANQANQLIPDDAVLAFAGVENRALLTLNRKHFIRLHSQKSDHAGIVVCTFDADFAGQAARIDAAINTTPQIARQLLRVNRPFA
jgi:hypothetical protein